ncbi:MAG: ACT domain-containing protein [Clostridiales bacterium]|nr:ACT domain-containing protein [Clostridiales bacterium]
MLKQLSVFVENHVGALSDATAVFADEGINLRALCIADTADFGIIRVIVDNPEEAADKLRAAGLVVNVCDVMAIKLPDEPGALHKVISMLSAERVSVEYAYAFVSKEPGTARLIMRVDDNAAAVRILKNGGIAAVDLGE